MSRDEQVAATAPSRTKLARARQAVKLLAGLRRDFDRAARETAGYPSKRYVAFGGAPGSSAWPRPDLRRPNFATRSRSGAARYREVPDDKLT